MPYQVQSLTLCTIADVLTSSLNTKDKKCLYSILSASVERFSVPHVQDFLILRCILQTWCSRGCFINTFVIYSYINSFIRSYFRSESLGHCLSKTRRTGELKF